MPSTPVPSALSAAPTVWLWFAVSLIPALLLLTALVGLWRRSAVGRKQSRPDVGEARAGLARTSESLWLATELADVGVWFWDLVSGTLTLSDRCRLHLGLPAHLPVTIDLFYSALHPDDRERVRAAVDHALAEPEEFRTSYRAILPDGTQRHLAAMGRCTFDPQGKPLSMGGVTLDVTRIARLESDLRDVSAVVRTQAADLEAAHRLQIVAENASDVVMETDNAGIVSWITPTVTQRIGHRPVELVGTPYASHVHPDDRDKVRALERQVQKGMAADAEVRLRSADGSYRWFSLSLRPVFDAQHGVVRRVGGWRDIHDEVLAREAAATERQRLRAQMMSMINPLVLAEPSRDEAGRVIDFVVADANPPACNFFRLGRERLQDRRLLDLMPQMATTGLIERFAETMETGRWTVIDNFPLPMPDGSVRWLDMRVVHADGGISFVWSDNTEKQAALQKITASEEQFRLLAENTLDVVMRIDANDKVAWVSPSVTSVLGWNVAECVGHDAGDFFASEETRRQYRRDKARVLAGEGAVSRSQFRSRTGEVHWMETHASPSRTAEGRIDGLITAMRVIDAEVRAEQALERRARTDDLTQLLNRKELLDRLAGLVARGERDMAVLWCDIDHFKATNDTHGHAAGDAVLRTLGDRIRSCLGSGDHLGARIGGDELMLVLRGGHSLEEAAGIAETIPFEGGTLDATLSIGVTLALPHDSVDSLLARADDAMYHAKEQGRNRVVALAADALVPSG